MSLLLSEVSMNHVTNGILVDIFYEVFCNPESNYLSIIAILRTTFLVCVFTCTYRHAAAVHTAVLNSLVIFFSMLRDLFAFLSYTTNTHMIDRHCCASVNIYVLLVFAAFVSLFDCLMIDFLFFEPALLTCSAQSLALITRNCF